MVSVNGRFNGTDCLPVTGKDGKIVWIFKLEDLKEVVDPEVYEVIEAFTQDEKDEAVDEFLSKRKQRVEVEEDGYLQLLMNTREELEAVIGKAEKRLVKKDVLSQLRRIHDNILNNI